MATSVETRTRFPELVIQEEKRVRFVVVNGLVIIEKPNSMPIEDAEWYVVGLFFLIFRRGYLRFAIFVCAYIFMTFLLISAGLND